MSAYSWSLLIHLIGFAMLFTSVLGAWILRAHYGGTTEWRTKVTILRVVRSFGLLSAVAVVLMLLSGLGNVYALGLTAQMPGWLQVKLILFVLAWAAGILSAVGGRRRAVLVVQIAEGNAPQDAPARALSMDARANVILVVQSALLLAIVILSVFKP
ncbi:MAG TPA: DUF2269 family protein [Bacteroidota bacterium]|nr:DUF2269 family protein [Bacteroidota bacterium]